MSARFGALSDDGIHTQALHALGQSHACHHRHHLDARLLESRNILAGIAGAGGHNRDFLLDDDLHELVHLRMHQHDVDAEGLIGEFPGPVDVLPELIGLHAAGGDESQTARIGDGCRKLTGGDVCHTALNDGVFGFDDVTNIHRGSSYQFISTEPQVSPLPKPASTMRSPRCRSSCSCISQSAMGMLAADVLP